MSEKKTLIVKDAAGADFDAFKKLKSDNGYTDAGALKHLLNLTRGDDNGLAVLKSENESLTTVNAELNSQVEERDEEILKLKQEIENLKARKPEKVTITKEVEVIKEVPVKLTPGQFIVTPPEALAAHMRKARLFVRKDKIATGDYESELACYSIQKFLDYDYSRFK